VKNFSELTEREVLAVAISSEEEDSRIYMTFAETSPSAIRIPPGSSKRWRNRSAVIVIAC
jgi:hypothetical protein